MSEKILYCKKHLAKIVGSKCPIDKRCNEFILFSDEKFKKFKEKLPKEHLKNIEKEKEDKTVNPNDLWG